MINFFVLRKINNRIKDNFLKMLALVLWDAVKRAFSIVTDDNKDNKSQFKKLLFEKKDDALLVSLMIGKDVMSEEIRSILPPEEAEQFTKNLQLLNNKITSKYSYA